MIPPSPPYPACAALPLLPVELLLEVAEHLLPHLSDLNNLELSNRRLYDSLNPTLYRSAASVDGGRRILFWAIKNNRAQLCDCLLTVYGVSTEISLPYSAPEDYIGPNGNPAPPISDKSYQKPLHIAAEYAAVDALEVLLRNGSDVAARDFSGMQPLHYACIHPECTHSTCEYTTLHENRVKTVKLLLQAGADVQSEAGQTCYPDNRGGWLPLHFAVLHNFRTIVDILILQNAGLAHVDHMSYYDETPLGVIAYVAARNCTWYPDREGYILRDMADIVKLFLKLGANAENACDNVSLTRVPDEVLGRLQSFVNDVGESI